MAEEKRKLKDVPVLDDFVSANEDIPLERSQRRRLREADRGEQDQMGSKPRGAMEEELCGFTAADIESLIGEAQERAAAFQGSSQGPTGDYSLLHGKENSIDYEGSHADERAGSQKFHHDVRRLFEELRGKEGKLCTVADLGSFLGDALKILEKDSQSCKPRSTTGSKDIFPLPVKAFSPKDPKDSFLQALILGLNSLYGTPGAPAVEKTPAAYEVIKRLQRVVQGSAVLDSPLSGSSFQDFFSVRGLDYSGDEVRLAQQVSWKLIEPSFPPEVGKLDLRDFCTGGVLHFVNHIEETIVDPIDQTIGRTPSVMVKEEDWVELATNLVKTGLCKVVPESSLHHVEGRPLLNGLFAVGKDELVNGAPVGRLIMNLKPWNAISRSLAGDIATLPMVTNMGALHLHDHEVLVTSSEDLRCFFYLFKAPRAWEKFMAFGKIAPPSLVPSGGSGERWYLTVQVLPMGYLNSVGIAQHIHRCVISRAVGSLRSIGENIQELRRDKVFSHCSNLCRVYLDNFDQLQKVDRRLAALLSGSPSDLVEQVRECYRAGGLPRHPKKSVEQSLQAEVQGAWLDGEAGTMCAKPSKVCRYVELTLEALKRGKASQRELQVIAGGLVYASMFRRPLLSGLNQVWRTIVELDEGSAYRRRWLPKEVMVELVRMLALLPLAFMAFRSPFDAEVTASDASTTGGGVCVSRGLTPFGQAASLSQVRGDLPEEMDFMQVLSIGLFDGIAALRVALDVLGAPVCGHISVEKNADARRVVEANFPDTVTVEDVELVDEVMVQKWALSFSGAAVVLIVAGPPCQGVSGLNSDRKGALRDLRSKLFVHVPRITALCRRHFPWAQVHSLTENVSSMDARDCEVMNAEFELEPWFIDASQMSLAHRPRLYWISWELCESAGVEIYYGSDGRLPIQGQVELVATIEDKHFLEPGWRRVEQKPLPTFTTSRPSPVPLRRPAGLKDCDEEELARWRQAMHKFPPYQFKRCHCLQDSQGRLRPPSVVEREVILGFPSGYTSQSLPKSLHGTQQHEDCRLTLLGNSWQVGVVAWLVSQLLSTLGVIEPLSLQSLVDRMRPGGSLALQGLLLRPPLGQGNQTFSPSDKLVAKLSGLVSMKGEDLLLQSSTEVPVRYHRLRSSLPARLWRWRAVAGWGWKGEPEHINVLEARAVLTAVRWRVSQRKQKDLRCIHLVDSLVVLHALTRGRTSSKKMRRTVMRISAYLLASGLQPLWAYVDTKQNPADAPSRRLVRKQWLKRWSNPRQTLANKKGKKSAKP